MLHLGYRSIIFWHAYFYILSFLWYTKKVFCIRFFAGRAVAAGLQISEKAISKVLEWKISLLCTNGNAAMRISYLRHILSLLGPACNLNPCIQRGNNVGASTLSVRLTATAASAWLPLLVKLSQFFGQSCFSNTTLVTSAQDTKSVDNKRAGLKTTGKTCLGRSTE